MTVLPNRLAGSNPVTVPNKDRPAFPFSKGYTLIKVNTSVEFRDAVLSVEKVDAVYVQVTKGEGSRTFRVVPSARQLRMSDFLDWEYPPVNMEDFAQAMAREDPNDAPDIHVYGLSLRYLCADMHERKHAGSNSGTPAAREGT